MSPYRRSNETVSRPPNSRCDVLNSNIIAINLNPRESISTKKHSEARHRTSAYIPAFTFLEEFFLQSLLSDLLLLAVDSLVPLMLSRKTLRCHFAPPLPKTLPPFPRPDISALLQSQRSGIKKQNRRVKETK
ncbi:hypothetical protein RchiOBHm_Chr4g0413111 [Rosa chinensis]|uniref:Uncharacterized protein n=1 Tax=Rosa chinensis TaxID=74649 RepID=A0A2P6QW24_ROSCH|nr:hypothetical protein RchiOBHm_Chr4g0413111 [Rosa chinensis]